MQHCTFVIYREDVSGSLQPRNETLLFGRRLEVHVVIWDVPYQSMHHETAHSTNYKTNCTAIEKT